MTGGARAAAKTGDRRDKVPPRTTGAGPTARAGTPTREPDRIIDGGLRTQCVWCQRWFDAGWIAYHNCEVLRRAGIA